ncbi:MAG: alpha/beta fold hydrolase [Verrucomicrobiales bacterium]|nr:alpha/beta fold hydrolase [Verrucomicrobiales bacterium]
MSELQITDRILASDTLGRYIRVREWLPANGISRGDALVLHGLGDHIARHDWAAGLLARAGYRAIGFDWPGNGKSDGVRGDMPTVPETGLFLEEMLEKLPCDPIGIFAHSTGGFLLLHWLGRRADSLSRLKWVWLSSPLLVPSHRQPKWKIALARRLVEWIPGFTLSTGVGLGDCFHNWKNLRQDAALLFDGSHHRISLRFASSLLETESQLEMKVAVGQIPSKLEFLITQGSEDCICPPVYAEALYRHLPASGKTFAFVSGARHEPFREYDHNGISNTVRSWLDARSQTES